MESLCRLSSVVKKNVIDQTEDVFAHAGPTYTIPEGHFKNLPNTPVLSHLSQLLHRFVHNTGLPVPRIIRGELPLVGNSPG